MVRVSSLFSQLLGQFPRNEFERLVRKHNAEYGAKGFTCWTQFVAMLFCQLARADSLRDICNGLSCCLGKLVHLGVFKAPKKSTLSYANAKRPAALFEDVFWSALERFRSRGELGGGKKFRFRNRLLTLDSTTISLCLELFDWASFRRTKGGVKAHVLLDHDDYMPTWALITEARRHDVTVAKALSFNPGTIVVVDRGYDDYTLFGRWTEEGVYFVTRLKANAAYRVTKRLRPPARGNVISDELIRLTGTASAKKCPHTLRKVAVWDEENMRTIVLLTNHLSFGATTIGAIYRDRWQVELFFKALKQNLKVKTFVGTSKNALLIQIWTALIALLLLKWLHHLSEAGWSLSNMAAMLRLNLFTYRDLLEWLENPFGTPPITPTAQQLLLPLLGLGQLNPDIKGAT
jgi:hypothetical protein